MLGERPVQIQCNAGPATPWRRPSDVLRLRPVDDILSNLPVYMMIGIVVVIGVSQLNRVAGAVMSVAFWLAVAVVGHHAYDAGHAIGVPGFEFPRPLFYAVCAGFAAMHVFAAIGYVRSKRRAVERRRLLDEDI